MPELKIMIDPLNPGQFYACCGLQELFRLQGVETVSHFEVTPRIPRRASFILHSDDSELDEWKLLALLTPDRFQDHEEKGLTPVILQMEHATLSLNWWLDSFQLTKTAWKGWAGQLTPSKLFAELPLLLPKSGDMMNHAVNTKTKFGIDPRSAWEALDIGFSPNEHTGANVYPAVELLGAIGLQGFRPVQPNPKERRQFSYCLWQDRLPAQVARTAPWPGLESKSFNFSVASRGSYAYFCLATPNQERNT